MRGVSSRRRSLPDSRTMSRCDDQMRVGMASLSFRSLADQYFGRCDTAHSRACSIGVRGGRAARYFLTLGNASILSRQLQKAGYLGYMVLPSSVRLNAKVLGSK